MKRVLSERDQWRAILMVAAAAGANRVADVVDRRVLWGSFLPLLGAFLAAVLIFRRDARTAAIASAASCAAGAALSPFGGYAIVIGSLLSTLGTGAFTVASFAFAAELLVPDEAHVSPSRFAGIAAFVFARVAMMDLGTMAWFELEPELEHGVFAHAFEIALTLACVALVMFALPREATPNAAGPTLPVYRAASPMEAPPAAVLPTPKIWAALRPFVAPAALFAFASSAVGYRMGAKANHLYAGATAIAGAIYFVRRWQRREVVVVIDWYARGLMLAAGGWVFVGLGLYAGTLTYLGALGATIGGTASGLSLGLVALAARGRRAGVALACWMLLANIAAAASDMLRYGGGVSLLLAAVFAFVIASGLRRRARELEASF